MATCSICEHPERRIIDVRIASGDPFAQLAERFDVGEDALGRHAAHANRNSGLREPFGTSKESLVEDLIKFKNIAEARLESADPKATAGLVREITKIDELIARWTGADRSLHDLCVPRRTWNATIEAIKRALAPYPDALEAVRAALDLTAREETRPQAQDRSGKKFVERTSHASIESDDFGGLE